MLYDILIYTTKTIYVIRRILYVKFVLGVIVLGVIVLGIFVLGVFILGVFCVKVYLYKS